jgi:hypothetical protein
MVHNKKYGTLACVIVGVRSSPLTLFTFVPDTFARDMVLIMFSSFFVTSTPGVGYIIQTVLTEFIALLGAYR